MQSFQDRKFYGWWIVAGGFILNFIGIGIAFNALGIFFKPVVEELGFKRGDFSLYFTIAALSMTFAAPIVGKLMERFNVRLVMGFCTALLGISFAMLSQCNTLSNFYILAVFIGIGHAGSHIIPVSTMINNWFRVKRGIAMGIVFSATGIGGMISNPVGNWLIINYGWRSTAIILGTVIFLISVPTATLIMRKTPEEIGQTPDGTPETAQDIAEAAEGLTLGQFVKTGSFILLALMIFFLNTLNVGIQQHLIPYLTDVGHSSTFAANIMALYLGMTVVGKLSLGRISDKKGLSTGLVIFCGILGLGIALLFGSRLVWVAITWGVIYGIGNAVQTVMPPLMTASCAGLKHFSTIYGVMAIFQTLGSGLGMPLSGYIFDKTGNYNIAFALYLVLCILSAALGYMALKNSVFSRRALSLESGVNS
ncbi:MAG TPA: MFS transporter [Desulfomonilia bacterium]